MAKQDKKQSAALRRGLRWLAAIALALLLIVAVVVAALLVQPARNGALRIAIDVAGASLPGRLRIDRAAWPSLGSIELHGVTWVDGADSLASADRIAVSVKLRSLVRRDVDLAEIGLQEPVVGPLGVERELRRLWQRRRVWGRRISHRWRVLRCEASSVRFQLPFIAHLTLLTPRRAETVKRLMVERRTSNIERPILMTLR